MITVPDRYRRTDRDGQMTCNLITALCVASRGKNHLRSSLLEVWTSIPCCLGPNCFTISWSYKIMCSLKDLCICWDCGKVLNTRIRPTVPWGSLLGRKTNGVWDWVYGIVYFVLPPYECHWKSANIQIPLLLQERRGVVGSEFLGLITRKRYDREQLRRPELLGMSSTG